MFAASNGVKYIVVTEAYQSTGIVDVTSLMGLAPPIPESPQFHLVPPGASFLLSMPATNWVPVPACRWRLNGQPITGATNTTLLLTNFSLSNTGAYSVVMSNLIGLATNTVALLGLAQAPYLQPARVMSGGNPAFAITITNAAPLVLQTATNLNAGQPWISLTTNPASGVTFAYTNAGLLAEPRRFFRAILWSPFGP
jgi:hypothetical protein